MPFKETVLPNGLVLIDSYDITPEEELAKFNRLNGVNLLPSVNYRSRLKNQSQQGKESIQQEREE